MLAATSEVSAAAARRRSSELGAAVKEALTAPSCWLEAKQQVKKVFKMWNLMTASVSKEEIVEALELYKIVTYKDLLRKADRRFGSMKTKAGANKALDTLVVATGFAHLGSDLLFWLENVAGMQERYNEMRDNTGKKRDYTPCDMEVLFNLAKHTFFGFEVEAVKAALLKNVKGEKFAASFLKSVYHVTKM